MRVADEGGGNGSVTDIIFALKNVAPEEFADRVTKQPSGRPATIIVWAAIH